MPDMMVLCACGSQSREPPPLRQRGRVIEARLSRSGRVPMRGLSRWCGQGGSSRTIPRFVNTSGHGCHRPWLLRRHQVLDADEGVVRSGDQGGVTPAGKTTSGGERGFASL
jgi:hypothetical protein